MTNPFQTFGQLPQTPQAQSEILPQEATGENTKNRIENLLTKNNVILFMKGNEVMPQCGFSANSINILKACGAQFQTFDILKDQEIRQGLKEYSNWPTFQQLYVSGQLIGGNDIISELHDSGELQGIFSKA